MGEPDWIEIQLNRIDAAFERGSISEQERDEAYDDVMRGEDQ